jgi:hypothetical protein
MAKRFTDSDKWKTPFIRSMKAPYKLLWLYLLDECDHAGIWQVDFDVAELKIGEKLKVEIALEQFGENIVVFDSGQRWFIPYYVDFQYGVLNPENRAHNSVIQLIAKWELPLKNKPLLSPLQGGKDKDKVKDKVSKSKEVLPNSEIDFSFCSVEYFGLWKRWLKYKFEIHGFKYKNLESETLALSNFVKNSNNNPNYAKEVLDNTISSGKWESIVFTDKLVAKWKDIKANEPAPLTVNDQSKIPPHKDLRLLNYVQEQSKQELIAMYGEQETELIIAAKTQQGTFYCDEQGEWQMQR